MNAINVEHPVKRFGAVPSGDDVGLAVREGGIFTPLLSIPLTGIRTLFRSLY